MNGKEAYDFEVARLTPEQTIQLGVRERNIGRELAAWEIVSIFKLAPYIEIRQPRKRRMSDEVEQNPNWQDQ